MATPINAPKAGEIWHLSIEDLFAPVEAAPRLGGDGPFVINLSVSTAPISVPAKAFAVCADAHVYQIQVTEDGRMRYRLRLGPFASEDEADAILAEVRETYPGALTATAGSVDLRTIGSLQAKIDSRKSHARKAPESPAQKKTEAPAQKALDGVAAAEISIDFVLPTSVSVPAPAAPRAAPAAPRAAPAAPRAAPAPHRAAPLPQRPAPAATPLAAIEPAPPPPAALPPLDLDPEWALPVLERRAAPAPAAKVAASPAPVPPPAAARAPKAAPIPAAKTVPVLTEEAAPKVEVPVLKPEIFNAAADAPVLTEVVAPVLQTVAAVNKPVRVQAEAPAPQAAPKEQMAVLVTEILGAAPHVAPAVAPHPVAPQPAAPQAATTPQAAVPKPAAPIAGASLASELANAIAQTPKLPPLKMHAPKAHSPNVHTPKTHTPKVNAPKVQTPKAPPPMAAKPAPVLTQSFAPTHKALVSKILARAVKSSKLTSLQHVVVATAPVPAARDVKQLSDPLDDLESTQTVRALSPVELEDEEGSRWFVIELAFADRPFDPDAVPNLDIFSEYRLYSVAGVEQGRPMHALRLGFFSEEIGAVAVASYLAAHYDKPMIKRVSIAERERFAHQRVEARKDVAETGTHAAIEITDELVARRKRTTKPASNTEQSGNAGLPWNSPFPVR